MIIGIIGATGCRGSKNAMQAQVPSPMQEHIRPHKRIMEKTYPGKKIVLDGVLTKTIVLYLPKQAENLKEIDLLIHFHGASFVPIHAVHELKRPMALVVVNQGSGSSVYQTAFKNSKVFKSLVDTAINELRLSKVKNVYCSSFSAGYGAVREVLKSHQDRIHGILLLDGLHSDYIPENTPLAEGGRLNEEKLVGFLNFAKAATEGRKRMLITHSEIFPGTYPSTTETAQWLLDQLAMKRNPVLAEGPGGMQRLSFSEKEQFKIWGFAGNSAPDHIDHLHGMTQFLEELVKEESPN